MIQNQIDSNVKILSKILTFNEETIFSIFGESGLHLLNFAKQVDPRHPELQAIFKNTEKLCQLLDLAEYAIKNELLIALEAISSYSSHLTSDFKHIDDPNKSQKNLRFFSEEKRIELRRRKESFLICSLSFQERAIRAWNSTPNDFSSFERNSEKSHAISDLSKRMAEKYRSIGCDDLAKSIETVVGQFDASECHYGFRKIGIAQSCFILAKLNGFALCENNQNSSIVINTSLGSYVYVPKVIPIVDPKWTSEKVQNAIAETEAFPEASFMPIFDHYIAIVPSFGEAFGPCNFKSHFVTKEDPMFNVVNSVILGERDGSCYFICTWK